MLGLLVFLQLFLSYSTLLLQNYLNLRKIYFQVFFENFDGVRVPDLPKAPLVKNFHKNIFFYNTVLEKGCQRIGLDDILFHLHIMT